MPQYSKRKLVMFFNINNNSVPYTIIVPCSFVHWDLKVLILQLLLILKWTNSLVQLVHPQFKSEFFESKVVMCEFFTYVLLQSELVFFF